jgi:hypothetical protein
LITITGFSVWGIINNTKSVNGVSSGTSLPISKGGTDATNALDALNNLGGLGKTTTPNQLYATDTLGNQITVPNGIPNRVNATNPSLAYKGQRFVTYGYGNSLGTNNWFKFYHGEGVGSGSDNTIVLKMSNIAYGTPAGYTEFIIQLKLATTTSINELTVSKVSSVGTGATIPEIIVSGDATSFDLWFQAKNYQYYVEFVAADEVSANDTLISRTDAVASAQSSAPTAAVTTSNGSGFVEPMYTTAEQATGEYWIDGKAIYRQAFTGNVSVSVGVEYKLDLVTNADKLIDYGGSFANGNTSIGRSDYGIDSYVSSTLYSYVKCVSNATSTSTPATISWTSMANMNRSGSYGHYNIWVEYTKP